VRATVPNVSGVAAYIRDMKKLLLATMVLFTEQALAQSVPPKGANVIIITTSDSAKVAYNKLASILLNAGYTIDKADKDLLFVNTKPKPAPRYNMEHAPRANITATATGSSILLRDSFTLPGAAAVASFMAGQQEVVYRGSKSSTFMVCWDELQRLAALYPNGKIEYANKP
jgi:hypothetical protein